MTTISYKDGTLAADSQVSAGNIICNNDFNKVLKFDSNEFGSVYIAAAGTLSHILEAFDFIEQLFAGEQPEAIKFASDQFQVVMMTEDGKLKEGLLTEASTNILWIDCESPWSIGSGSQIAIGAMAQGASAEESVKIASKRDCYTNDNVKVYNASELSYVNLLKSQRDTLDEQIKIMESEELVDDLWEDFKDPLTSIVDDNIEEEPSTVPDDVVENTDKIVMVDTFQEQLNCLNNRSEYLDELQKSLDRAEVGVKYDWDGSGKFPSNLREGDEVTVYFRDGDVSNDNIPGYWKWNHEQSVRDIISYELIIPVEES